MNALGHAGIIVVLELEVRGGDGVFLIVFADFREIVLDVDAFVELFFEVRFELLLLTANLA